jgi:opacity protein-like surface antigen
MITKVFLTAMAVVFCSTVLFAQHAARKVSFGINLQPHVNWIRGDESFIGKGPVRLGIEGGLRLDYKFERFFALSFGVGLNQTGGNIVYKENLYLDLNSGLDTLLPGTRVSYRLQYVEVPAALKFILPEIGYQTWFAEVGLDPMFNTKAFINATDNNIAKEPFQQGVSRFNLAWHTGIGVTYSLGGNLSLQAALVYKNTFLDVTRENEIRKADNARINQVGLRMGIVF